MRQLDRLRRLLKETTSKWWDDNALRLSAALSYYTLFSLAPLLTLAVTVAAVVAEEEAVQIELRIQVESLVGPPAAEAMANMLLSAGQPVHGSIATLVSLVTLLVVSMGMFSELQDSLNLIWRIRSAGRSVLWGALRKRWFSFLLVLGTGFLLLTSLIMNAVLAALGQVLLRAVAWAPLIMSLVDVVTSPIVITVLFALLFKVLPEGHIAWGDVWIGALAAARLFTFGTWAIDVYLGSAAMASMYGAASSLMAILLWVYYSATIFFLGAEFTYVYAHHYGSRRIPG
jgi:membrane protein